MSEQVRQEEFILRLGGVVVRLISGDPNIEFKIHLKERHFVSHAKPEISIYIHSGPMPRYSRGKKVFDSGGPWDLYRSKGKWVFRIRFRRSNNSLAKLAIFDNNFKFGDIYLGFSKPTKHDLINYYLGYHLGHFILSSFLFLNHGAVLHACGVSDRGKGILFVGPSGRGKTTMASLWQKRKGVILLSDDRVALRKKRGGFYIYGIPRFGHGMGHLSSPEGAPLERIFFLEHGQKNSVYALMKDEALSNLLITAFPPVWNPYGMKNILDVFTEIIEKVPCSRLSFVPNRRVVNLVRKIE